MPSRFVQLAARLKPSRRWCQFSIKSLLVLVAVLALPCGLLAWKLEKKREQRAAIEEIERLGDYSLAIWDWQEDELDEPPGPAWLRATGRRLLQRRIQGQDFFQGLRTKS
jgi:hypothetical protein